MFWPDCGKSVHQASANESAFSHLTAGESALDKSPPLRLMHMLATSRSVSKCDSAILGVSQ